MITNFLIIYTPLDMSLYYYKPRITEAFRQIFKVGAIFRAVSFGIFSLYIFSAFFIHFKFFVEKKKERMILEGKRFGWRHQFVIIWAMFIATFKLLYAFDSTVIVTI